MGAGRPLTEFCGQLLLIYVGVRVGLAGLERSCGLGEEEIRRRGGVVIRYRGGSFRGPDKGGSTGGLDATGSDGCADGNLSFGSFVLVSEEAAIH